MLIDKIVDTAYRIQQIADGGIVVKRVDYVRHIFAHIDLHIPGHGEQLRCAVDKICGKYFINIKFNQMNREKIFFNRKLLCALFFK